MRNLAVDADIVAYQIAARSEDVYDFDGDGENLAIELHPEDIPAMCEEEIAKYCQEADADRVYICLSDPSGTGYFRRELEPTYKMTSGREARKPELLQAVKNYLAAEYPYYVRPRLEADDIMGILATHPKLLEGETIMCSSDKDMRTIPAKLYNPGRPELGVIDISELDADRFLMYQTIVGDSTDGYPGCRGVGPASVYAEEIIGADRDELWDIVLDAYASKGFTEADAIHQARLARILRAEDYNYKTQKIKLWNPTKLLWKSIT